MSWVTRYKNRLKKQINNYKIFIKSDKWERLKIKYKKDYCCLCESKEYLHLHHIDYRSIDNPLKLVTLCKKCHHDIHYQDGKKIPLTGKGFMLRNRFMERLGINTKQELAAYLSKTITTDSKRQSNYQSRNAEFDSETQARLDYLTERG